MMGDGKEEQIRALTITPESREFRKGCEILINNWEIEDPVDLLLVRRMVAIWFRIEEIDRILKHQGLTFTQLDSQGNFKGVKVNEAAMYQKQLESELRGYYRILNNKYSKITGDGEVKDLMQLINGGDGGRGAVGEGKKGKERKSGKRKGGRWD